VRPYCDSSLHLTPPMDLLSTFSSIGIALGLGLLVGLQREQVATQLAGLRTFALITVLGTICGLLALSFGGWIIASGFLALTGALLSGHVAELKGEKAESGVTTEVAALAMFGVGAYLVAGYHEVAIVIGAGIAVLLHFKGQLHGIAARLGEDSKSIMQFALISMVILPILPNRTFGPYEVLNPRQIWLMVVLIVGIGLGGYIAYKFFGAKAGLLLAGLLGGTISSTATTVSYSKRAAKHEVDVTPSAIVILLASTVSCALAIVEIAIVAPGFLLTAFLPLSIVVMTLAAFSLGLWFLHRYDGLAMPTQNNPSELRIGIYFAVLYALILFAIAVVKARYGVRELYLVAAVSGLAEVHALTLSTSQLVEAGRIGRSEGWRIVAVALVSNLVFKVVIATALSERRLSKDVALPCILTVVVGIGVLILWP
jgi:uncharacterized membrane protein (DUF4010 family)